MHASAIFICYLSGIFIQFSLNIFLLPGFRHRQRSIRSHRHHCYTAGDEPLHPNLSRYAESSPFIEKASKTSSYFHEKERKILSNVSPSLPFTTNIIIYVFSFPFTFLRLLSYVFSLAQPRLWAFKSRS